MDDDGQILPPTKPGEIVARGTLVSGGYYNMPEATAEIRTHGWHHTGDVGYIATKTVMSTSSIARKT